MTPKYQSLMMPRFSDFDLQGILNSRQYMDLLAEARFDQMNRCYKIPMETFTERGQSFVLRSFEIQYKKPIYFGSSVIVETYVEEIRGPLAKICFRFLSSDSKQEITYASGVAQYFLIELSSKKPVDFPDDIKRVYLGTR